MPQGMGYDKKPGNKAKAPTLGEMIKKMGKKVDRHLDRALDAGMPMTKKQAMDY